MKKTKKTKPDFSKPKPAKKTVEVPFEEKAEIEDKDDLYIFE
mgnify:CR=1 FL=1